MAINIPPDQPGSGSKSPAVNSAGSPAASRKVEGSADAPRESRNETTVVKAIVAEVHAKAAEIKTKAEAQAQQASAQNSRTVYDAVVQLNPGSRQLSAPQTGSGQPPVTEIDTQLARQIQEGKPVAVRVETTAPLRTGQLLDVQLNDSGLKLLKVSPPPLQLTAQPLIRQEINLQNSYTQLLGKLVALVQTLRQGAPTVTDPVGSKSPAGVAAPSGAGVSGPVAARESAAITPPLPRVMPTPANTAETGAGTAPEFATKLAAPQRSGQQTTAPGISNARNEPTGDSKTADIKSPESSTADHKAAGSRIVFPGLPPARQEQLVQRLEQLVSRFMATLPTDNEILSPNGLKQAVKNSGIFYEGRLAQGHPPGKPSETGRNEQQPVAGNKSAGPGQATGAAPRESTGKAADLLQQVRRQIQSLRASLGETSLTPAKDSARSPNPAPQIAPRDPALVRDLKYNLLQLEAGLRQLQKEATLPPVTGQAPAKPDAGAGEAIGGRPGDAATIKASPAAEAAKALDAKSPDTKSLDKVLLEQGRLQSGKGDNLTPEQAARAAAESRRHSPVYQRPVPSPGSSPPVYQEDGADDQIKARPSGLEWAHPPLPGKVHVQPQMIRPSLSAAESLADALISVLIKHTREATSRLNLHQLTSLTDRARPEAGPQQTMLSFELPILQGLDLSLFQFRIYDEDSHQSGKSNTAGQEKKWVVHMGFDLEGLGPMYCQITLVGVSASVTFWAEDKNTVTASQAHIDNLRNNLNKIGVNVKEIQCINGTPPTDQSGIQQTLIDIET